MSIDCDCVVIGAGVVGLAVAARLASAGRDVIILEAQDDYGTVSSARNSEVIHAGIYYPAGSVKAQLCVEGKQALYAYCQERAIPFKQCGKLIVASDAAQRDKLASIQAQAANNGVHDLQMLTAEQACAFEPQLHCTAALLSPSTGIIDSHALMVSLLGDAENNGAVLVCRTQVCAIMALQTSQGYKVCTEQGESISCLQVVNTAGHGACELASTMASNVAKHSAKSSSNNASQALHLKPAMYKGNYFSLTGKSPFSRLIYPVPEQHGLGVHLTLDLAGSARFGPDVQPVSTEDYSVNPARAAGFYAAIRKYWPALPDACLQPDYAGIRPRVVANGQLQTDFMLLGSKAHGQRGVVHALGIESPGLTACLAIAEAIESQLTTDLVR